MMLRPFLLVLGLLALGLIACPSDAETFCVSSPLELRNALSDASANGQDDTVKVVQNTYLTGGDQFYYFTSQDFALVMLGGYEPGCSAYVLDPTNTVLDGEDLGRVISFFPDNFTAGDLVFRGFTVRRGFSTGFDQGAGLSIGGSMGHSGDVVVDHCIFIDNNTDYIGGGLAGGSDTGTTRIENNLIVNNGADIHGGASLTSNGTAYLTNNTVAANTGAQAAGLRLGGTATGVHSIANNIIYGNSGTDLQLSASDILVENNDVGSMTGTPGPGSGGNLSVDPLFVGGDDFHVLLASPVINQGANAPPGGLSATDVEGLARIHDGTVDMGAYEHHGQPDAVELISLQVIPDTRAIRLVWRTTFESTLLGFHVYRSAGTPDAPSVRLTPSLIEPEPPYELVDRDVETGATYFYRIVAISRSGESQTFGPVAGRLLDGPRLVLEQCSPNPFFSSAQSTVIRFELSRPSPVTLDIFEPSGRHVRRLVDESMGAGAHTAEWDGRDDREEVVAAGIYLYRVVAGNTSSTRQLVKLQ